ncbi:OsmC family protein [Geobacter sulfurreducens]|jgi:putative redox protein|uniref:Osmotically inducible protein OsmC n=1 Tax=Geobacter sulfurreducens (strain ATCC 51573 / DSM 12127 / PCA) TaxID=243231 RepID=Q74G66_GEOSL|nr:OsmC family protein [Geobacter sulfurreducens]AAR33714.1 hypothetical protein GSU0382 [Geobacter sulfurreducens PCA]ADI83213.1 hypothetical protein KN400_0350 [Geobacter sulfurreducens KN400]AJY70106.1 osmotically inducible protein OsmC [Geobacter sulfurreducens]QVW35639.1 OsmC family protein [Geobacter sulfurreducens]UAC04463.1 OsmC family protein [Geobacter sulfurreducens]
MELIVTFPGGKKVNAELGGMVIPTDQPVESGGEGTAPSPYDYFLASIGTCAGFYVLAFCQQRGIATENISLRQAMEFTPTADGRKKLSRVQMEIVVPSDFPEKYRNALVKSAELCSVKRALADPPDFAIRTVVA